MNNTVLSALHYSPAVSTCNRTSLTFRVPTTPTPSLTTSTMSAPFAYVNFVKTQPGTGLLYIDGMNPVRSKVVPSRTKTKLLGATIPEMAAAKRHVTKLLNAENPNSDMLRVFVETRLFPLYNGNICALEAFISELETFVDQASFPVDAPLPGHDEDFAVAERRFREVLARKEAEEHNYAVLMRFNILRVWQDDVLPVLEDCLRMDIDVLDKDLNTTQRYISQYRDTVNECLRVFSEAFRVAAREVLGRQHHLLPGNTEDMARMLKAANWVEEARKVLSPP